MNSVVLRQVFDTLHSSTISSFILSCKSNSSNRLYRFLISSEKIVIEKKDNNLNLEVSTSYSNVEDMDLVEELTPTEIKEVRYNGSGLLLRTEKRKVYKEADLMLVLFKVLRENVVFVLQNDNVTRVCYYISSRVMFIRTSPKVVELVETNLYKLYNSMPGAKMIMFSALPRKYSCGDFYTTQNKIALRDNKIFRNCKEGVGVR